MRKTNNSNFYVILGVFIIASIARVAFDVNQYILHIIASINVVSLWYVLYLNIEECDKLLKKYLKDDKNISDNIKGKKRKLFKGVVKFVRILLLVSGVLYIVFGANSIVNDIIGLLALFFSIEDECICSCIANYYKNKK